jgi:hypothetical protein
VAADDIDTFEGVRHLVLAHGLERLAFELALELWRDAEEVDCQAEDGNDAGEGCEDLGGGHVGGWIGEDRGFKKMERV